MVIQQKIMPTTMDPTQAKMMLLLPVFLTFLFLTFPAGLVIYWLTNNVLTIAQQFITDRFVLKKPPPPPAAPGAGSPPESNPEGTNGTASPTTTVGDRQNRKRKGKGSQKDGG